MSVPLVPVITAAVNLDGIITVKWGDTVGALTHTVSISPGSFTPQTVVGKETTFTGATTMTTQYTVSVYATNGNGNSATVTRIVDDFMFGLIWWLDASDTSTLTFGPNRAVGSYSFPTVTKIADKSGTGTAGSKDAVIPTAAMRITTNIISGATQNPVSATTGPVYISNLTTSVAQDSGVLGYAGYAGPTFIPSAGIDRPSLLFRGMSNTGTPSGYDSLQGTPGGNQTSRVPLTFFSVVKELGNASFFGSGGDVNSYIGWDNAYGVYGRTGADSLTPSGGAGLATAKSNFNFVVLGVYEEAGTQNLNTNINGNVAYSGRTALIRDGYRNFNTMRICGRSSGYTPSGFFSELMLHQRVLSSSEIKHLEGYMAMKWNLGSSLLPAHPYYNQSIAPAFESMVAPVIYNTPTVTLETIIRGNRSSAGKTIDDLIALLGTNYTKTYTSDINGIAIFGAPIANGSWEYSLDNGVTWVFLSGPSATNHLLLSGTNRLRFRPGSTYVGPSSNLSFYPWNGTGYAGGTAIQDTSFGTAITDLRNAGALGTTTAIAIVDITLTGVANVAPQINNAPTVSLTSINEDVTTPTGTTVASILTSVGSNYVTGTATNRGIAITSAPSTNGNWQYSTNSGSAWTNMTGLTSTNNLLLTGVGTTNMIRFVPATNFSGSASLTFRAWDTSAGTAGTTATVSTTGGTSIYSSGTATVNITVNPINDAPIITGGYVFSSINADLTTSTAPVSIDTILTSFVLTDADISNAQSVTSLAIIGADSAVGTWYYSKDNQATWISLTGVSAATAVHFNRNESEFVKFEATSNAVSGTTFIQIRAWDKTNSDSLTNGIGNASTGGTTTAYSTNTPTLNLTITNKPTAPINVTSTNVSGGIQVSWQTPSNIGNSAITQYTVYEVANDSSTLKATTANTSAIITTSLVLEQPYTYEVIATNSAGDGPASSTTTIVFKGAPELVEGSQVDLEAIVEDTTNSAGDTVQTIMSQLGTAYTPANSTDAKGIAIISAPNTNGVWQYSINGGSSWTNIPPLTGTNHFLLSAASAANKIRFVPTTNFYGSSSILFRGWDTKTGTNATTIAVSSFGSTTSYSTGTASAHILISNQNDAPVITGTYTFTELQATQSMTPISIESILSNYTITDADESNAQSTTSLAIIGADSAVGTWYYSKDNQATWTTLTGISAATAVHFNRDSIEFVKFEASSSTISGTTYIQIRAWDKTNSNLLTNGIGNASVGGTTTAYSINTPTINMAVVSAPAAPTSLAASIQNNSIQVSWAAPINNGGSAVTGYRVYSIVNSIETLLDTVQSTQTSYSITTGIELGTTYGYAVRAINAIGESASATISVLYVVPPDAPTGVEATLQGANIRVSWTAPLGNGGATITGYKIYTVDNNIETLLTTVSGTQTSYAITTGIELGNTYTYVVKAANSAGDSNSSSPTQVLYATVPDAPINVMSTLVDNNIEVSWNFPLNNGGSSITNYKVYSVLNSVETLLTTVSSSEYSYLITSGITLGSQYTYIVRAINSVGSSAASESTVILYAKAPGAPTNISTTAGTSSVSITWSAPSFIGASSITSYSIYNLNTSSLLITTTNTQATITNLSSNTLYNYYITVTNSAGIASVTNQLFSFTTLVGDGGGGGSGGSDGSGGGGSSGGGSGGGGSGGGGSGGGSGGGGSGGGTIAPRSVEVNFQVEIIGDSTISILGDEFQPPSNVIVAEKTLPVEALYDSVNKIGLIEVWEPSSDPDNIYVQLANTDSSAQGGENLLGAYKIALKTFAKELEKILCDRFDCVNATPYNEPKYAGIPEYTVQRDFGRVALGVFAHYLFGHVDATSAITNDTEFIMNMLSLDKSTTAKYNLSKLATEDETSTGPSARYNAYSSTHLSEIETVDIRNWSNSAGLNFDANLAKRLTAALVGKGLNIDGTEKVSYVVNNLSENDKKKELSHIVKQVIGQDATRLMDEDNSERRKNIRRLLRFYPNDVIYMNIKLNTPNIIVQNGQQITATALEANYSQINYTLKITLE
jgi:hypothetical protein